MHSSRILLVVGLVAVSAFTLTEGYVLKHHTVTMNTTIFIIENMCPFSSFYCPKKDYLDAETGGWNYTALQTSEMIEAIRTTFHGNQLYESLRDETCCVEDACLAQCGIQRKDTPKDQRLEDVEKLFKYDIPEIKKYETLVMNYYRSQQGKPRRLSSDPAYIENFKDEVYNNRHQIDKDLYKRIIN